VKIKNLLAFLPVGLDMLYVYLVRPSGVVPSTAFTTKLPVPPPLRVLVHDSGAGTIVAKALVAPNSATMASTLPDKSKDFLILMIVLLMFRPGTTSLYFLTHNSVGES